MGTCFGIVSYVDGPNTGTIAGIVGAGGNMGAVWLGNIFRSNDYDYAMEYMGWFTVVMAFLTPLIVIKVRSVDVTNERCCCLYTTLNWVSHMSFVNVRATKVSYLGGRRIEKHMCH